MNYNDTFTNDLFVVCIADNVHEDILQTCNVHEVSRERWKKNESIIINYCTCCSVVEGTHLVSKKLH